MIKRLTVFAVAFTALSSAAALAAAPYTAHPATPVAGARDVTTDSVIWNCKGDTCVSASSLENASPTSACRQLKREVGLLAGFNTGKADFTPEQLAACNGQPAPKAAAGH
jgi:hypothetical protein